MDHVIATTSTAVRADEEPLFLVHGFLGSPASFEAVRARLSRRLETLTLPGHGEEPIDEGSFDDALTRVLARLGRRPRGATLLGYSMGARVALGLAARAERPFARLVLVSGRDGLSDRDEAAARRAHDDALAASLLAGGLEAFVARWEALPLFESQRALPEEIRAAHRRRRLAHDPVRVAAALRVLSLGRMPRYGADAAVRTPRIDLVVGADDPKFAALARAFAREHAHRARVRVHEVPGAGHDVGLERPDALAAILEQSR